MPSFSQFPIGPFLNKVYATADTCVSDSDLSFGSSSFGTDQTEKLQTLLNKAQTAPLFLIWNGAYTTTGLTIYSNTHILAAPGCGAILRTNANAPLMTNGGFSAGAITDHDITIDGGIWNGNGPNQSHQPMTYLLQSTFYFWGITRLNIRNAVFYSPSNYSTHVGNVNYYTANNNFFNTGTNTLGYALDGLHVTGPATGLNFTNNRFSCNDDAISIMADDGNMFPSTGAITDVLIDGVELLNLHAQANYGIRFTSTVSLVDKVVVRNVTGVTRARVLIADNMASNGYVFTNPGVGNFGDFLIDGVNVNLVAGTGTGTTTEAMYLASGTFSNLTFRNILCNGQALSKPVFLIGYSATTATIKHLEFDGIVSLQTNVSTPTIRINAAQTVTNLILNDLDLNRTGLYAGSAVYLNNATGVNVMASNCISANSAYLIGVENAATNTITYSNLQLLSGTALIAIVAGSTVNYSGSSVGTLLFNAGTANIKTGSSVVAAGYP